MKPIYAGDRIVQLQKNSLFVNITETASKILDLKKGNTVSMYVYGDTLMMVKPEDLAKDENYQDPIEDDVNEA